jgi:copper chaperone CopZ
MIPLSITHGHVIKALEEIDANTIPQGRESTKFVLVFNGRRYPPKYVISLANKFINGEELNPSEFSGGQETNNFLKRLGFDIEEITLRRTKDKLKTPQNESIETTQKEHNERCSECKNTVERMLKKIYGAVEPNYKFNIGTNPENFRDTPYYEDIRRIFVNLQKYRENKNFVYTDTLPNCDYFVPSPGFVVEFDESQHFTIQRKIALLSYPYKSKSGFSLAQWVSICDKTQAHDPEPIYRDEQRAWYDTLRDFLPELRGNLEPTVRLYSKEMQWCSLDPDNPDDIARFKNIIEGRRRDLNNWIATVVLQSNFLSIDAEFEDGLNNGIISEKLKDAFKTERFSISENARVRKEKDDKWVITDGEKSCIIKKEEGKLNIYKCSNEERMNVLSKVVESILEKSLGDGVILFPAGMFSTGEEETRTFYNEVEETVKNILSKIERNIVVCTGIDGSVDGDGYSHDQIGIAVSKDGIDAIGRKFYPADQEKEHVKCAENHSSEEGGKSRIFELNGVKYFICVCYDIFGIRHKELSNSEGVDVVLNLVHCFYLKGEGPAGESYFARHGFAGASKQWGCPVFSAVVFFNREIPERWPTGIYWNQGDKGTPKWKYEDNPLKCSGEFKVDISEGIALVRIFC